MSFAPIKLTYVLADFGIGGVQRVVLDILQHIDLNKYDVSVVVLSKIDTLIKASPVSDKIKFYFLDYQFDNSYRLKDYLKASFFKSHTRKRAEKVVQTLYEIQPDIIHFHTLPRELMIGILVKEKLPRVELVFTDHSVRISTYDYKKHIRIGLGLAYRNLYRHYHVIAVSKTVEDVAKKYGFIAKNKCYKRIENQIHLDKFLQISYEKKSLLTLVYVSRITPTKGQDELIIAFSKLHASTPIQLYLVGPDELGGKLQRLAQELRLTNVHFLGARNDVPEILSNCDIGVFPSHKEGMPVALLEKMACGLPVVASDIPEITDIVKHNENGLIFRCKDTDDLARKLTQLIEDAPLRKRLGEAARKTIEQRFGQGTTAKMNEQFYEEILNEFVKKGRFL
ncbi:MAG: glycosyltransferase family 4 protein [Flammeovirgaceae bacterium]|nr:glycosyltransferase family 4 protein [Flammeovirgaceae bacterium]MDW8286944.1 glycosyltransferase family 4 protein [Flammeovirgaceae bacterium]